MDAVYKSIVWQNGGFHGALKGNAEKNRSIQIDAFRPMKESTWVASRRGNQATNGKKKKEELTAGRERQSSIE